MRNSSALISESPLIVLPTLACVLGLNNAIVLQQIQYWLSMDGNGVESDGYKWVYNTYESWNRQFPFWSEDTIYRSIRQLEDKKVLISEKLWKYRTNQTKFYRIDIDQLNELVLAFLQTPSPHLADIINHRNLPPSISATCGVLYTETTTESTTESSGDLKNKSQNANSKDLTTEEEIMGKGPTSANAVLNHIKAVQAPIKIETGEDNLKKIQKVYRKSNPNFVAKFTDKQNGMFNHILQRTPKPLETTKYVLENWISFTKYVEEAVGINTSPLKPTVDFLLKYCEVAYSYYEENNSVQLIAKPIVKEAVKPTVITLDETKHVPATLEEILALALED